MFLLNILQDYLKSFFYIKQNYVLRKLKGAVIGKVNVINSTLKLRNMCVKGNELTNIMFHFLNYKDLGSYEANG